MADEIRFQFMATPVESLSDDEGNAYYVISGEIGGSVGYAGSATCTDYSGGSSTQGFMNGAANYFEATVSATSAISPETTSSFVFIRNTGYQFRTSAAVGATIVSQSVQVNIGDTMVSVLNNGEGVAFKDNNKAIAASNINVKAVDTDGSATPSGLSIAVEYLVVD